jgi:hypothetical protein
MAKYILRQKNGLTLSSYKFDWEEDENQSFINNEETGYPSLFSLEEARRLQHSILIVGSGTEYDIVLYSQGKERDIVESTCDDLVIKAYNLMIEFREHVKCDNHVEMLEELAKSYTKAMHDWRMNAEHCE